MSQKKHIYLLILLLGTLYTQATTWETVSRGFWQDSSVWVGGIVPDTSSADTFLINHPVVIECGLNLESGAFIKINENGGICGHQIATVLGGAKLDVYGILELDELYVNSGLVTINKGNVKLTTYAQISGQGARLKVEEDASFIVGEWFECLLPDYAFALIGTSSINKKTIDPAISVYPNPFSRTITLENPFNQSAVVTIFNSVGTEVYTRVLHIEKAERIDLSQLKSGIYWLVFMSEQESKVEKLFKY